jgi:DNA uptake protein ComE-like DNA-binding protein
VHRALIMAAAVLTLLTTLACGGSSRSTVSATNAGDSAAAATAVGPDTGASGAGGSAPGAAQPAKLNLNTATREQLLTIPNVGDRMVREFMEYRPYRSILQFRREIGKYVSQEQVAEYEKYVFVPVDPNEADVETLRQLPGVDAAVAAQLIAGRPYASAQDFLARLAQYVSPEQAAAARAYLVTS